MMRSITVGPETVALGALTLLTGDAQALRSAIATLGELGAIHVDFGHDRQRRHPARRRRRRRTRAARHHRHPRVRGAHTPTCPPLCAPWSKTRSNATSR